MSSPVVDVPTEPIEASLDSLLERVWVDGCFDILHYAHGNALRQARMLAASSGKKPYVIAGVHSDEEILRKKGPCVMSLAERAELLRAVRYVDEVHAGAPWDLDLSVLDEVGASYAAHGDDVVIAIDGTDCYAEAKRAGRFKTFKRTDGVSTTDILRRIMDETAEADEAIGESASSGGDVAVASSVTSGSGFFFRTAMLSAIAPSRTPLNTDKVVLVHGVFDIVHAGHIALLKRARECGTYVLVSLVSDEAYKAATGRLPLLSVAERALNIVIYRDVDDVVLGSPMNITAQMLSALNIDCVVTGPRIDETVFEQCIENEILQTTNSEFDYLSRDVITSRIIDNRSVYMERQRQKMAREIASSQLTHDQA